MADQTAYLNLTLMGFNEYADAWGYSINNNWEAVDLWSSRVEGELLDARLSKPTLKELLEVGHNSDGTLKATGEVVEARSSRYLGRKDLLSDRISLTEAELWRSFAGQGDLASGLAMTGGKKSLFLSSLPASWITATGETVSFNPGVAPIWLLIEGKPYRIRTIQTHELTGGSGARYLYVEKPANPVVKETGVTGVISSDPDLGAVNFTQLNATFTTNVKVGDILNIYGQEGDNAVVNGDYVVEVVTAGNLKIAGKFPVASLSTVQWKVIDPYAVTVGADTALVDVSGKFYVGTCTYNESNAVTSISYCQAGDTYVSEWETVSASGHAFFGSGHQFNHNLMTDELDISFQVKNGTSVEVIPGAARLMWDKTKVMVKSTAVYSTTFYTKFDGGATTVPIDIRVVARKRG